MATRQRKRPAIQFEQRYTTAPVDYDGFGTRDRGVAGYDGDKPVRLVEIDPRHLEWQTGRYGSGLHAALTRSQWDGLVRAGLARWAQVVY